MEPGAAEDGRPCVCSYRTVIVVLGFLRAKHAPHPPSEALRLRVEAAVAERARRKDANGEEVAMILSGGDPQRIGRTEAHDMRGVAERLGVPSCVIFEEDRARYTIENAYFVARMLDRGECARCSGEQLGRRTLVVVTSSFHMERSKWIFKPVFEHGGIEVAPSETFDLEFVSAPNGEPRTLERETGKSLEKFELMELRQLVARDGKMKSSLLTERLRAHECLAFAAKMNNVGGARSWVERFGEEKILTSKMRGGSNALHYSALYGSAEVLEYLLQYPVDVNARNDGGATPLHFAIMCNRLEARQKICALLERAAARDDIEGESGLWEGKKTARQLKEEALNTHVSQLSMSLCAFGEDRAVGMLSDACIRGEVAAVRQWLDESPPGWWKPLHGKQSTPLHFAATHGHVDVLELLLDAGVDVDIQNSFGATPLHYAVLRQHHIAVKALVARGADASISGCSSLWNYTARTPKELADLAVQEASTIRDELAQLP